MYWRKLIFRFLFVVSLLYIVGCALVYLNQESLMFHPTKLASGHQLAFTAPFEELRFKTSDGQQLDGVLFRSETPKGKLVFFVHGNTGSIENQEGVAEFYKALGYDFFTFDFRGFGKSTGEITSEDQFYNDARLVYSAMKQRYAEEDIVIIGYSIGTATATLLAAENNPKQLILMAPYYSMQDMAAYKYPMVPPFLVSYPFAICELLPQVKVPVTIFHGKTDKAVPYYSSKMLAGLMKKGDNFVPLNDQGHNGIEQHPVFAAVISALFSDEHPTPLH